MLGAARFGDILVGAGAEWEGGRQVSWQGQAMFVKTAEGRLALWDLGSKTEVSFSKFSGADRWVLFQSGKEKGLGDYRRTNYYRGSQDLPAPSLIGNWQDGPSAYVDIYTDYRDARMILEGMIFVTGVGTLIVDPTSKIAAVLGAVGAGGSLALMVADYIEDNWVISRTPILYSGPRPAPPEVGAWP